MILSLHSHSSDDTFIETLRSLVAPGRLTAGMVSKWVVAGIQASRRASSVDAARMCCTGTLSRLVYIHWITRTHKETPQ